MQVLLQSELPQRSTIHSYTGIEVPKHDVRVMRQKFHFNLCNGKQRIQVTTWASVCNVCINYWPARSCQNAADSTNSYASFLVTWCATVVSKHLSQELCEFLGCSLRIVIFLSVWRPFPATLRRPACSESMTCFHIQGVILTSNEANSTTTPDRSFLDLNMSPP